MHIDAERIIIAISSLLHLDPNLKENWERVTAGGQVDEDFIRIAKDALHLASRIDGFRINLFGSPVDYDSISDPDFLDENQGTDWTATVTKNILLDSLFEDRRIARFFIFKESNFAPLMSGLNAFETQKNPFLNQEKPVQVFCKKLKKPFGGPQIGFFPTIESLGEAPSDWPSTSLKLPSKEKINSTIHVASKFDCTISPSSFYIDWGDTDSDDAKYIRLLSAKTLSAALCHDFFSEERVTLDGIKRRDIALCSEKDITPTSEVLRKITEAVIWVYEERIGTRSRLLADRLSLDIANSDSLLSGLSEHITDALKQSQNKYQFIILDRKNDYASELSNLLKDLRIQADLFSSKLRSLTSGLTRDTLATLALISITLITRLGDNSQFLSSDTADKLFKCLAIYIFVSASVQGATAYLDTKSSWTELAYWKGVLREHMGLEEIDSHIKSSLRFRQISFGILHGLLLTLYGLIGLIAWHFSFFYNSF